jgi:predicted ATPase
MARLALFLFGPLHVTLDGQPANGFESAKVRALLIYLAVEADRPHRRSALAGLLWPEQPEDVARNNLRQALANLRRAIADQQAQPPFLVSTRETVQFNAASDHWLDVTAFDSLLAACASHAHRHPASCKLCMQRMAQAAGLYQGDFLAQFSVSGTVAFEEWALIQRARHQHLALEILARLAAYHERRGEYEPAQRYAARQLELDPWREEAHRQLMAVLSRSGRRNEALVQYEQCRRILADELGVEPEPATTALYEQIRTAVSSELAVQALKTPDSAFVTQYQHTFPAQLTSFVGREEELAALAELLANPTCRLITIIGPGGIGKTRLALQAAAEQAEMFAAGAAFVPLAALSAVDFLIPAITGALNIPSQSQQSLKDQLLVYLRERELLLVLDNFEQLLAGADLLAEILARAPGVTLLVTSRERLALHGEWLFDLEGLSYPAGESIEQLERYSAVQLFTQRAGQVQRRFALTEDQAPSAARICRLVEGLPLAIELAAATVRERSCAEIAAAIETNLLALVTPLRNIPERHRSVWAAFEHSWRLLSQEQRRVMRRLAVFRGGFMLAAAASVVLSSELKVLNSEQDNSELEIQNLALEPSEGSELLTTLAALVHKSLLRRSPAGRYEIHELVRQYAGQKLRAAREQDQAHAAHLDYFLRFAELAEPQLTGPDQAIWLDRLELENDNLRAALGWSLDRSLVEPAARLAGAMWRFWMARGYLGEGRDWLERVLVPGNPLAPALRAKALKANGVLAWSQGEYRQAIQFCEMSLAIYQQLSDRDGIATCLHYLGSLALHQGEYARAAQLLEASLALRHELGDRWGVATCLNNLGALAGRQGDIVQAERFYEQGLVVARELGDKERIAVMLDNLGAVARDRRDYAQARRLYEEGLALFRAVNNRWNIPTCLNNLGGIALDQRDYARARTLFRESLALLQDLGDKEGIAECLEGLAGVASGPGRPESIRRAARLVGAAAGLRAAIGSSLAPVDRSLHERTVAAIRAGMNEATFVAAHSEGRALALDQAIAYALQDD